MPTYKKFKFKSVKNIEIKHLHPTYLPLMDGAIFKHDLSLVMSPALIFMPLILLCLFTWLIFFTLLNMCIVIEESFSYVGIELVDYDVARSKSVHSASSLSKWEPPWLAYFSIVLFNLNFVCVTIQTLYNVHVYHKQFWKRYEEIVWWWPFPVLWWVPSPSLI